MRNSIQRVTLIFTILLLATACNTENQAQPNSFTPFAQGDLTRDRVTPYDKTVPSDPYNPYNDAGQNNQLGYNNQVGTNDLAGTNNDAGFNNQSRTNNNQAGMDNHAGGANQNRGQNAQGFGQGTKSPEAPKRNQKAQEKASRLVKLATSVEKVNDATAVVAGRWAVVGIDVDAKLDRSEVGSIKYSVAEALKGDPLGAYAIVTSDADTTYRLRQMAKEIREGKPIGGVMDELAAIVGRLMPQVPRQVQNPKTKPENKPELQNNQPQNQNQTKKQPNANKQNR